jgi:hypothetical protein
MKGMAFGVFRWITLVKRHGQPSRFYAPIGFRSHRIKSRIFSEVKFLGRFLPPLDVSDEMDGSSPAAVLLEHSGDGSPMRAIETNLESTKCLAVVPPTSIIARRELWMLTSRRRLVLLVSVVRTRGSDMLPMS